MSNIDLFPASYAQQRLWFLDKLYSNTNMFNIPFGWFIEGQLDPEILRKVLLHITYRHEAFRTKFIEKDSVLFQVINSEAHLSLEVFNTSAMGDSCKIAKLILGNMAREPFDLQIGPLFRIVLVEHSNFQHSLLFVIHHIIFDGWSINVLAEELDRLYEAFSNGSVNPLADLSVQYVDFAAWQHNWLGGDVIDKQVDYWRNKLKNLNSMLDLPFNKSPTTLTSHRANSISIILEADVVTSLRKISQKNQVTIFIFLISVFGILISRYSRQNDICIGYPVSNRNHIELEGVIGFFVNILPLRIQLEEVTTFEELLKKIRENIFEASEYQDIPFEKVVEILQPYRELNRAPLFQTLFTLDTLIPKRIRNSYLKMTPLLTSSTNDTQLDLTLSLTETIEGSISGVIEYKADLFDQIKIEKMVEHFNVLLKYVVADPQSEIKKIPLLTELEQQEILIDWNNTEVKYPRDKNICELFEEQVQKTPDDIAVVFGDQQITYRELNIKANQLAGYLIGIGVKPDSLVTIYMSRSIEMIITVLGVLKAGGAYVPIDIEYPIERLKYILQDTATQILLTKSILSNQLPQENIKIIYLDQNWHEIQKYSPSNLKQICYADNLAYCIFTSGSTGKPKGTLNTLRGFTNLVQWYSGEIINNINPIKMLLISSFGFDLTQKNIFGTLVNGGRIIIPQGEISDIDQLRLTVLKHNPTHINCAPSVFNAYKDILANDSVHTVILGGEVINSSLIEFFQKRRINLINSYGPTECSDVVTFYRYEANSTNIAVIPIGRPISNVQIYILDSNFMLVPVGVTGELYISGDGVGRGYLNRPDLTAEKFVPNPFGKPGSRMYRTGDLARYLLDGSIEFEGRKDHQIKIRGFRIELGEVESALQEIKAIEKAVVLVSEELDKRLVAYLVTEDGVNLNIMELRAQLQKLLPEYMIPSDWIFIHEFPLTPNGKVDRKALAGLKGSREAVSNGYIAPRTEIEKIVATIWEEVLKVERVSINDNFFALGGHSLLLPKVLIKLRIILKVQLPIQELFKKSTLEEVANLIAELTDY
ncbi:amino acid adenylation domain-containing protein [Acinetobacter sp. ACIN00229]|uniref:non-ribosomal peptide synthetase n=1 Tax=Acinetobacter sp. ACIN00229 TaxID=2792607 RepID=UPI0018DF9FCD|nr:non-ribosomal peptide synthetase [Acinetobacter sp. ACIN00229]MBI0421286.1 amino acid adenylation domain-containing protein [Acinetobacter sp. ACIN00229]